MNKKGGVNTVLMVMPDAFHSGWMGATKRIFQIALALGKSGNHVILLAGRETGAIVQADADKKFPGKVFRTNHSGAYPSLFEGRNRLKRLWRGLWKLRGSDFYLSMLSMGWASKLNVPMLQEEFARQQIQIDLVWGISAGYLDGAAAAYKLSQYLDVPFVLELHDPPYGAGLGIDRPAVRKDFLNLIQKAKAVISTSASYETLLMKSFGLSPEKSNVIHLTYENLRRGRVSSCSPISVIYAGSLTGGRSLAPLIHALGQLKSDFKSKLPIQLVLIGTGAGFCEAIDLGTKLGISENIDYLGYLSGPELSEWLEGASVHVIIQTREASSYQIPGKVFDCIADGKPILGIMSPECEAAEILRNSGLGIVHSESDIAGLQHSLLTFYERTKYESENMTPNLDYISQFGVENLPIKLSKLLPFQNDAINLK